MSLLSREGAGGRVWQRQILNLANLQNCLLRNEAGCLLLRDTTLKTGKGVIPDGALTKIAVSIQPVGWYSASFVNCAGTGLSDNGAT